LANAYPAMVARIAAPTALTTAYTMLLRSQVA
jgi:hypothetical protein